MISKSSVKKESKLVQTSSQNKSFLNKTPIQHKKDLSNKPSQRNFLINKWKVSNFNSTPNFQSKNNENFMKSYSSDGLFVILKIMDFQNNIFKEMVFKSLIKRIFEIHHMLFINKMLVIPKDFKLKQYQCFQNLILFK